MVTDLFGSILQDLGKLLKIEGLHEDDNRSCLIRLQTGQQVQLEIDRSGQFLVMGADLGLVPSGRYRLELFEAALKANGQPHPIHGILAYSSKNEHLVIFEKLPFIDLTGEKVANALAAFSNKAKNWADALEHNEIPKMSSGYTSSHGSGMFGLAP